MKKILSIAVAAVAVLAACGPAGALINPKFTPVDLVQSADLVAVLKLSAPDAKGKVVAEVRKSLKGKPAADKLTIDLSTAAQKEHAKAVGEAIARLGNDPALLFIGKDESKESAGFLNLAGRWVRLEQQEDGGLAMIGTDAGMQGTWAGGTDMLLRAIEYILSDDSAEVPAAVGFPWGERKELGKIEGKVNLMQAVDLPGLPLNLPSALPSALPSTQPSKSDGGGLLSLFVGADRGDRIYRYDPKAKEFKDVTASTKLASKSQLAAWADFNGDGRLDLASWDGKTLTLWLQAADGTFPDKGSGLGGQIKDGCLSLAVIDAGGGRRAGLLVGTVQGPVLLASGKDGAFTGAPLPRPAATAKELGTPGLCLAADLDGDGLFDVLELFASGSLFYKGKGGGAFAEPVKCAIATGKGRPVAFVGDFDADGRLDVFTASEDGCGLWHNRGELKFEESFGLTGELAYTAGPEPLAGTACDINNDGRQDIMLAYPASIPMIFFNRGFRSFGKALELTEQNVIPETAGGQQAGTVEDLNGDGAQDMALVLKDGTVMVLLRKTYEGDTPLAVRAVLPPGSSFAGPLTVTGWAGSRCLGAWSVAAGSPGAFFGRPSAGDVVLKWQLPGDKPREKKLALVDQGLRVDLDSPK